MDYQITNKFVINKNKNIGKVLYVVEGEKTEINLLYKIFNKILGYNIVFTKRSDSNVNSYLVNPNNKNSIVYVINSKTSNISSIKDKNFIDNEVLKISKENPDLNIDVQNIRKYYIYDCDRKEDNEGLIKELLNKYNNALDSNLDYTYGGMLLLNYPSIESFVLENFLKDSFRINDFLIENRRIKEYLNKKKILPNKMSLETLNFSICEFINALDYIGINSINLDNISDNNIKIYNFERDRNYNYILSLFFVSLIDLGIIEFCEK